MGEDRLYRATIAFAAALIVYMANGRTPGWGDTVPARYLPLTILGEHDFDLDEFPQMYDVVGNYWAKKIRGAWVSAYPVGPGVAALPFFAPAVLSGRLSAEDGDACRRMEKLAAAAIVALSVAFLYLALLRLTDPGAAAWLALAYALGTSSMSVSSQALWQHGPSQLCFALGLFLLVEGREGRPSLGAAAGLPLAFAVVCRPTNLMPLLPLAAYAVFTGGRRQAIGFLAAAALPAIFLLAYNVAYFGTPLWLQFSFEDQKLWKSGRVIEFLGGFLISPSRGLFFYSPFALFGVAGLVLAWRRGGDWLLRALGVGLVLWLALHARWWMWWGGTTYGPRLTADLTPLLTLAIVPCVAAMRRSTAVRIAFGAAVVWSIFAHVSGAYWDDGTWNDRLAGPRLYASLWDWRDNQLVDAPYGMARALAEETGLRRTPFDAAAAARLRKRGEEDTRRDSYWTQLRELHERAGDADGAAAVEAIRRARFTPSERRDWQFEDELTLLGVDHVVESPRVHRITYYWRAERWLAEDYAMTTELRGDGCRLKSEFVLGYPDATTKGWNPGETFKTIDRLELPADVPAAGCELELGVWAPASRRKLYIRHWPRWKRRATVLVFTPRTSTDMSRAQ